MRHLGIERFVKKDWRPPALVLAAAVIVMATLRIDDYRSRRPGTTFIDNGIAQLEEKYNRAKKDLPDPVKAEIEDYLDQAHTFRKELGTQTESDGRANLAVASGLRALDCATESNSDNNQK